MVAGPSYLDGLLCRLLGQPLSAGSQAADVSGGDERHPDQPGHDLGDLVLDADRQQDRQRADRPVRPVLEVDVLLQGAFRTR